ncbi:LysR family transcriptional regulator [Caballeronia glebae]|uniref:LysR family transcriptional regulator n=1 Tax=Caballeronia glebae TaxID=1777143 RepID=A0A158AZ86_9BURK|nr:LysR family transcriptional regulator [Caballeronia glebae]SAK63288.1 LysR family transcriptional regulator [Caballeronia glebae]
MLTFKQMEALYWIVQLGSFEQAASKLNASQSAISKRIQELETSFDFQVFDRRHRTARLTEKGSELFDYAKELLERRDAIIDRVSSKEVLVRRIRVGVTELTALTWLPRLIAAIRESYPKVLVEAEVESTAELRERLTADTIDLVIVPQSVFTERFTVTKVGAVENAWMCAPALHPGRSVIPLEDIIEFPLIFQGNVSGTGQVYTQFLSENSVNPTRFLVSNNLIAQVGLTVSGLGVSYLPAHCLGYLVDAGVLQILRTRPALPPVQYVALYRSEHQFSLSSQVARLAKEVCDFKANLLAPTLT